MGEEVPQQQQHYENERDNVVQIRIDVAEMRGMFTQVVSTHESRITNHDARLDAHETRLNEKGKQIARHDERLKDTETIKATVHLLSDIVSRVDERLKDVEADNTARSGRAIAIAATAISGFVGLLALFNFINGTLV